MFTFIEKLLFVVIKLTIIEMCYRIILFLYRLGMDRIYDNIIQLKMLLYLPTSVRKYLQNIKRCCFSSDWQYVLNHAIQNNHVKCIKRAFENGCEWNSDICNKLMLLNHSECLLYAHSNNCDWDWCTCDQVNGDVRACVDSGISSINNHTSDPNTDICDKLSLLNNEKCLLFAHTNGYDWDWCTCDDLNGDVYTCVKNGLYKIHVIPTLDA